MGLQAKPKACIGCPLYGNGQGYVGHEVKQGTSVTCIAQNPGDSEEQEWRPLCGRTGKMLEGEFEKYGIERKHVNLLNVLACRAETQDERGRWTKTNALPSDPDVLKQAVEHCTREHLYPALHKTKENVVVLLGDLALETLTGRSGIERWRGSSWVQEAGVLKGRKVLPTIHPSYLFQAPTLRTAWKSDVARVARESKRHELVVSYQDNFRLSVSVEEFRDLLKSLSGRLVALDVETSRDKPIDAELSLVGVAWGKSDAANVWVTKENLADVLLAVQDADVDWVTGGPFDYTVFMKYGVKFDWSRCHDVILLHSRFDIELPHDVAFICSMWTDRCFWKWMSGVDKAYYNALDCVGAWEAFHRLSTYVKMREPKVWALYERDRLMNKLAAKLHLVGLPWSDEQAEKEKAWYEGQEKAAEAEVIEQINKHKEPEAEPVTNCPDHPRYTGKAKPTLRKGEGEICARCLAVYESASKAKPLKLTQRTRIIALLKDFGVKVPKSRSGKNKGKESIAKGNVAKIIKEYVGTWIAVMLSRYAEFKEHFTVITRYFSEAKISPATGRIHSSYKMHTAKHRWASSEPNSQQFKKPEEET